MLFALLCVRNRFLFSTRLYEQGDGGANSILIEQAKHFTLLVGNYSRERFNHPGPAYMYVQAFGEYLFQNALHLVPTAWNAHMLSVFALDCAFVALAVGVVYGWTRSLRGAAACFAVFAGFAIAYPPIVNSDWMPYMYVLAYMVFILAAASVAAGRARDAWIFALTGWFLIHGHACFLLFVPAVTVAVLAAVLWPRQATLRASAGEFLREQRRAWIPVAVISAVFALPIVVNLVLHWPGDFGKYISYGGSGRAGGHGVRQVVEYALWFWWPHHHAWLAPVLGYPVALAAVRWLSPAPLRGFLLAMLAVNVVSSLAFLLYTAVGIDKLSEYYIGYFYWSAPLVTVLVIVLAAVEAVPRPGAAGSPLALRLSTGVAVLAAVAAVAALAVIPGTRTGSTNDIDEALPQVVATLAARAHGQDDRAAHRRAGLGRDDRVPGPGGAHRGQGLPARPVVHVPDDQAVHLHARADRGRPGLLVLHAARPAAAHAGHPALQRHGGRARLAMTSVGREQEAPALTAAPARTPAAALAIRSGLVALAAAVLFFCYWRQSQAAPLSSDGSGNVLQAWDMLHGNLLLHNWWVSDVSFYTTELPQYMLVEALTGLGPWVVHVAAAMTYTLLVLLAALLAKGRAGGAAGWGRALLAAGLMLAPQLSATSILLLSPDHIGTAVPLLVTWLLIDRAPPRWYVPVLVCLLFTWTMVADSIVLLTGIVPLLLIAAGRAFAGLIRRGGPRAARWYELSLAGAAAVAGVAGSFAPRLLVALGGYQQSPVGADTDLSQLQHGAWVTLQAFLELFGANVFNTSFWGARPALEVVFVALHLAGAIVAACALGVGIARIFRFGELIVPVFAVAIVLNLGAYMISTHAQDLLGAREMAGVLPLGAVLTGRVLGDRIAAWARAGEELVRPGARRARGRLSRHARLRRRAGVGAGRERAAGQLAGGPPADRRAGHLLAGQQHDRGQRPAGRGQRRGAGCPRPARAVPVGERQRELRPGTALRELRRGGRAIRAARHAAVRGAHVRPPGADLPRRRLHHPGLEHEPAGQAGRAGAEVRPGVTCTGSGAWPPPAARA